MAELTGEKNGGSLPFLRRALSSCSIGGERNLPSPFFCAGGQAAVFSAPAFRTEEGIYSLSPYTLEEVVARNYLINERPDAILNIIDGTNLERNLYLTTQLTELGIPVVVAINMMDVVRKKGDKIHTDELSKALGCRVVEISALKSDGIMDAAEAAIDAAQNGKTVPMHTFSGPVEHAIAHIEEAAVHSLPEEQQRWYAIKIFERDDKVLEKLGLKGEELAEARKRGDRTGLDTLVVHAVNDEC